MKPIEHPNLLRFDPPVLNTTVEKTRTLGIRLVRGQSPGPLWVGNKRRKQKRENSLIPRQIRFQVSRSPSSVNTVGTAVDRFRDFALCFGGPVKSDLKELRRNINQIRVIISSPNEDLTGFAPNASELVRDSVFVWTCATVKYSTVEAPT